MTNANATLQYAAHKLVEAITHAAANSESGCEVRHKFCLRAIADVERELAEAKEILTNKKAAA